VSPSMLDLALSYAQQGIPVFPVRASDSPDGAAKTPLTGNGLRAATTRKFIIERWWRDNPEAAVGIPTGPTSGFFVVDLDKKADADGEAELARLEATHEPLPPTRTVLTPSGGKHLLFKHVDGIGNRGRFAPACDIRGDGGYVLAPGSVMGTGEFYDCPDPAAPIADAPEWLIDIIKKPAYTPPVATAGAPSTSYVEAAVASELGRLASTRAGRNGALNDAAFALGTFVGAGVLQRHEAEARLYAAATACGYTAKDGERAARQTIKSGLDSGAAQPRAIPQQADDGMAAEGARLASKLIAKVLEGQTQTVASEDAGVFTNVDTIADSDRATTRPLEDKTIRATPFEWKDPSSLPRREFVFGTHLIRRYLSVTVAPGGVGKSSLAIVEALSMVTGRALLGGVKPVKPLRCWLYNGEDPRDELERRIAAACIHYNIKPDEIGDRLFIDTGRERGIVIAHDDRNRTIIATPVVNQVMDTMRSNGIDVLIIDPFVSSHAVAENDNGAIDRVAKLWSQIADDTDAAIEVIHHVKKTEGREITVDDGRGASALLAAVRSARVLNRMTEDQAAKAGVSADERMRTFNVQRGKANLAPISAEAEWRRLESVPIGNGRGLQAPQDFAGVVVEWEWPGKEEIAAAVPEDGIALMKVRVANTECRLSDQSEQWVGYTVAAALGIDLPVSRSKSPEKVRVANMVRAWIESGVLVVEDADDPRHAGRMVKVVRVAKRTEGEDI